MEIRRITSAKDASHGGIGRNPAVAGSILPPERANRRGVAGVLSGRNPADFHRTVRLCHRGLSELLWHGSHAIFSAGTAGAGGVSDPFCRGDSDRIGDLTGGHVADRRSGDLTDDLSECGVSIGAGEERTVGIFLKKDPHTPQKLT